MNLPVLKRRALWIFVVALTATGGYFAHTAWQTSSTGTRSKDRAQRTG